mgnify:CR=1 FL=1
MVGFGRFRLVSCRFQVLLEDVDLGHVRQAALRLVANGTDDQGAIAAPDAAERALRAMDITYVRHMCKLK